MPEKRSKMDVAEARVRLHSKFPDLRREAVQLLADSEVPDLLELLLQRLRQENEQSVLRALLQAVTDMEDPAAVPALLELLQVPPYTGAAGAVARALRHFRTELPAEQLIPSLQSGDALVRMATAELLGSVGDPVAVPALENALLDQNGNVVAAAARALWQLVPRQAPARLLAAVARREPDQWWPLTGFFNEYPAAGATVVPELLALAEQAEASGRQLDSIKVLAAVGDARAIPFLTKYLSHQRLWAEAATALGQFEHPAAREALWAAFAEAEQPERQLGLLQALAEHHLSETVPHLVELLNSPRLREMPPMVAQRIAHAAAELLVEAGANQPVTQILRQQEGWFGIPQIHGAEWLPLYVDLLRQPGHVLRRDEGALKTLRQNLVQMDLDGVAVVPALLDLLRTDDTFAATVAAEVLGNIRSSEAIPYLVETVRAGKAFAARPLVKHIASGAPGSQAGQAVVATLLRDESLPPEARKALRDACLRFSVPPAIGELIYGLPELRPRQRQVMMADWRKVEVDETLAARIFEERARIFYQILAFAGAFGPRLDLEEFLARTRDEIRHYSRQFLLNQRSDNAYHDLNRIFLNELPAALVARLRAYLPAAHEEVYDLLRRYLLGFYHTLTIAQAFTRSVAEAEFLVVAEAKLVERTADLFQQEPELQKLEATVLMLPEHLLFDLKQHVSFFNFDYEFGYRSFFERLSQALASTQLTLDWSHDEAQQTLHFAIDDASWFLANVRFPHEELDIPFYELLEEVKLHLKDNGWYWLDVVTGGQTASVVIVPRAQAALLRQYLPHYEDRRTQLLYGYRHSPHALP